MKQALIAAALVLATAGTVAADDTDVTDVTDIRFDDADRVEGVSQVPWLDPVIIRRPGDRRSLIRIRDTFVQEMLKSVEVL